MKYNFKSFIRLLMPPILFKFYYAALRVKRNEVTFSGVYNNITDIQITNSGYNNDSWIDDINSSTKEKIQKVSEGIHIQIPEHLSSIFNLMTITSSLVSHNRKIKIIDFGGGMGTTYLDCIASGINPQTMEYHIVDLPKVISPAINLFSTMTFSPYFHTETPKTQPLDLFYIGSALQYIPNYKKFLLETADLNSKYIFLANHFMGDISTFATEQVNMGDKTMGYWVFSKEEIISILSKRYEMISKTTNFLPFHNFNNFPEKYKNIFSTNLLFRRLDE